MLVKNTHTHTADLKLEVIPSDMFDHCIIIISSCRQTGYVLTEGKMLILGLLHATCGLSLRFQSCHLFQDLATRQGCRNRLRALKD